MKKLKRLFTTLVAVLMVLTYAPTKVWGEDYEVTYFPTGGDEWADGSLKEALEYSYTLEKDAAASIQLNDDVTLSENLSINYSGDSERVYAISSGKSDEDMNELEVTIYPNEHTITIPVNAKVYLEDNVSVDGGAFSLFSAPEGYSVVKAKLEEYYWVQRDSASDPAWTSIWWEKEGVNATQQQLASSPAAIAVSVYLDGDEDDSFFPQCSTLDENETVQESLDSLWTAMIDMFGDLSADYELAVRVIAAGTLDECKAALGYVAQIGETQYKSFDEAVAAAQAGNTIVLLDNITFGTDRSVPVWGGSGEQPFNIDLNGHTFQTDSKVSIDASNNGYKASAFCFAFDNEANITVSDGNIKTAYGAGIYVSGENVNLTLDNVNIAQNYPQNVQTTNEYSSAVRITYEGNVVINGGTYGGKNSIAVSNSGGTVVINDGTFNNDIFFSSYTSKSYYDNSRDAVKSITINGGTFLGNFVNPDKGNLVIKGGSFTSDPTAYVAEGYKVTEAGGVYTVSAVNYVAQIDNEKYETLEAAVEAADDGDTIVLLADLTQDNGIIFNKSNSSVKLDLNGKTFTVNTGSNANNRAIKIVAGTLEVYNGTVTAVGAGTTKDNGTGCYGAFRVEADGVLNGHDLVLNNSRPWGLNVKVLGGEATLTNVTINSSYGGGIEVTEASLGDNSKKGSATLTNCTINQENYYDHCSTALSVSGGSELIVNSGSYTGEYALYVFSSGGEIEINGGTFTGLQNSGRKAFIAAIDLGSYPEYEGGLVLNDGNFVGDFAITSPAYASISGGLFTTDPTAYVAEGYDAVEIVDPTYSYKVVRYVAQIDDVQYETLDAAVAAATTGQTVELINDVDLSHTVVVDKTITLNLAGHTIFNTTDIWSDDEWSLISVRDNGNLTINDTAGNGALVAKENDCYAIDVKADGATLTINAGTYNGNVTAIYAHTGAVTINGGTFIIQQLYPDYRFTLNCLDANYANGTASFAVYGGSFYNYDPSNNLAEGANTNFVVPGYEAKQSGDYYTVSQKMVAKIGTTEYPTLADAIAAVADNTQTTIVMIADEDIEGNTGVTVPSTKNIVLDLNGHTIQNLVNENKASQVITNKGTLTVTDNSADGDGVIRNNVADGTVAGNWYSTPQANYVTNVITNYGTLVINGGTLYQTSNGYIAFAVDNITNGNLHTPVATINGGTLKSEMTTVRLFCNSTTNLNTVVMTGGNVESKRHAFYLQNANSKANKGSLEITDGTVSSTLNYLQIDVGADCSQLDASITGGNFVGALSVDATYKKFISGGKFAVEPNSDYIVEGYAALTNTDEDSATYPYIVGVEVTYVAQIGDVQYETLAAAINAANQAENGVKTTIVLINDEAFDYTTGGMTINAGKVVEIDLNGHQVVGTANSGTTSAFINNYGSLTILDSTDVDEDGADCGRLAAGANPSWVWDGSDSYSGSYASNLINNLGTVVVKSGLLQNLSSGSAAYVVDNNSTSYDVSLTVTGGKLLAAKSSVRQFANSKTHTNALTVTGGTIQGGRFGVVVHEYGQLAMNLSGGTITTTDTDNYAVNVWTTSSTDTQYANINVSGDVVIDGYLYLTDLGRKSSTGTPATVSISGGYIEGLIFYGNTDGLEGSVTGGHYALNSVTDDNVAYLLSEQCIADGYEVAENQGADAEEYPYLVQEAVTYVAQIGNVKYETLAAAVAAANGGDPITLLRDVALTQRLFVNAGANPAYAGTNNRYATTSENKAITLDLNGYDITSSSNIALAGGSLNITGEGTISTTTSGLAPIEVRGTGDLTSKRTLTIGENVVVDGTTGKYGINIFGSNDTQKNIIDVTINGTVKETVFVLGNLKNAYNEINIVVKGSVLATTSSDGKPQVGIALNGNADVTVYAGAVIQGESGIEVRAGSLTVQGGTITATADTYSYNPNGSGSTTKGAAIAVAQHTTKLDTEVTLNGGTLEGTKLIGVTDVNNDMSNVEVVATQSFVQNSSIPEDCDWKETTPGTYELTMVVAEVNGTKYETLDAAAAAATAGDTIILLDDITFGTDRSVPVWEKNFNIDLNGHTLTTNSNQGVNQSNNGYTASAICFGDTTVTAYTRNNIITNGTIKTAYGAGVYLDGSKSTTVLSGLTINQNYPNNVQTTDEYSAAVRLTGNATAIIESGTYSGKNAIAVSNSGGDVTINDGTFTGSIFFNIGGDASAKKITINGGTFVANDSEELFVNPSKETLVIKGGTFDHDPTAYVAQGYEAQDNGNGTWTVVESTHTHVYDNEHVVWRNIRGELTAIFTYYCSCGDFETEIVTPTFVDNAGIRTYTAESVLYDGVVATTTKTLNYTVKLNNITVGTAYNWGDVCTLTAGEGNYMKWYLKGNEDVVFADGTDTYTFPVTGSIDIANKESEHVGQQAVVSASLTSTEAGKASFQAKWSIPTGNTVTSVKIYRGYSIADKDVPAASLIERGTTRDINLKVINGDYKLNLRGLTSGTYQHAVIEITYYDGNEYHILTSTVQKVQVAS